eukprot:TRINITY_DN585_c0_g1_i1.p1 TRINITY_DN585_c0_g1~~TRINITY_DN585_c0_g1_i1.p1  ORF type:complete len:329 (+),score=30.27 TRINITY_DN585_c0_g1_i1:103-1089(+)
MAAVSSFSALRCVNRSLVNPQPLAARKTIGLSMCMPKTLKGTRTVIASQITLSSISNRWKTNLKAYAEEGGETVEGSGSSEGTVTETTTVVEEEEEPTEIKDLKRSLVDSFYGTERGLRASSETRAEIIELITQLESKNPTPVPTEALSLLNGKWILAYTTFSELFPLLAAGILPLVKVKEISQKFDSETFTVENSVQFAGPLATTSFSTSATFEIRSPKRVQIKFEEGIISTPQLTDSIEIPESVEFLGQKIDLNPFKGVINSVQNAASSVARNISERPPIKFPIRTDRAQSWLLTTYLDKELRISRGDGSSVFVLIKDGSPLLPPT